MSNSAVMGIKILLDTESMNLAMIQAKQL